MKYKNKNKNSSGDSLINGQIQGLTAAVQHEFLPNYFIPHVCMFRLTELILV
jgi:hypothetical protein